MARLARSISCLFLWFSCLCFLQCEARNCAFVGWKKRMVCDDEVASEVPEKSRTQKGGAGMGNGASSVGNKKKGFRGSGGVGGGGGNSGHFHHHHQAIRTDPGFWPDPLTLSGNNTDASSIMLDSKVAFLFLSQGPLPLEPLWRQFFKADLTNLYSIYIHPTPEFDCDDHFNETSPFYGKCLPRGLVVRTSLGSPSKVAATRNLLSYALHNDPKNRYFALVSDSCIPLYPLKSIHAFLHHTDSTWMLHIGTGSATSRSDLAAQVFNETEYQLGSHWFVLNRKHADIVSKETALWNKYRTYCEVPGRGELCTFLVSQQRATKKIMDQIVGPHAGQEGGKSKTRISISIQRGKVLERMEFLDCYMQKFRQLPVDDTTECRSLQVEYNALMFNISSSLEEEKKDIGSSFSSSLSTMVDAATDNNSTIISTETVIKNESQNKEGKGTGFKNPSNNNNDNRVFQLPSDLPLEKTAMEYGRIAQRIVNRKCYPKANNIRYDEREKERGFKCVPDVRYFPSTIAISSGQEDGMTSWDSSVWNDVRPFKLTSSSRAKNSDQGMYAKLAEKCVMGFSDGLQPVEFISGSCITKEVLDEIRSPKGTVQLFARKFKVGMLNNLLDLNYLG